MKSTKKLIPAIAMLLVSAVVLSSASYAWFTMSKDVQAQNMKLTVTAPTNLLISNASNGTYASTTDLTAKGSIYATNANLTKLYPASSWDGDVFTATTKNTNDGVPINTTEYFTDAADVDAVGNANYAGMGFYKDYMVYLKTTGDKTVSVAIDNANTSIALDANDTSGAADSIKCVRAAIVAQQIVAKATASANDWFAATYTDDAAVGPSAKTATEKFQAASTAITANNVISHADCFGVENDSNTNLVNAVLGPMKWDATGSTWTPYTGAADATNLTDGATAIITVNPAEEVTAVLIRVWFEGQSDFCATEIANAMINVDIGFKTVAEA